MRLCAVVQAPKQQEALRLKMMRDLYGPGLPACRQIETQILSKCGALLLALPPLCIPLTARVRSTCDMHTSLVCSRRALAFLVLTASLDARQQAAPALLPSPVAGARLNWRLTAGARRVQGGAPAGHALLQAGPAVADGRARHVRL